MSARNLPPAPSFIAEPFARPGMSIISTVAWVTLAGFTMRSMAYNRSSGTGITQRLDLVELKAEREVAAFVFDIQLKMVVFPVPDRPIIPHLSAIEKSFGSGYKYKEKYP
jgi:hypothetical protein